MPQADQLFAEDFEIGARFEGATNPVSEDSFAAFAGMTGDAHPIHYDQAYAEQTPLGGRVAHGLLLMSMTALGATPLSARLNDAMVAFLDQGCRFLKPVFIGDAVTSSFEVAEVTLKPGRDTGIVRFAVTLTSRAGETVLDGHHLYLLRRRPAG